LASRTPLEKPPDPDQIEVSLFGPGIGESVVVHLGLGEWMVIDSCVDSRTRVPAALQYLNKLGVDISRSVKVLVITHWHNDHMRGAARIFEISESSTVVCSAALRTPEFAALLAASARELVDDLELPEFTKILEILGQRRRGVRGASVGPEYALEGRLLYRRDSLSGCEAEVHALSPSDGALTLAHRELGRYLPKYKHAKLAPVALSPNNVAVVLWITVGTAQVLLGSDLEESGNPQLGWQAIVNSPTRPNALAQTFKIPHHGSVTAHNDDVWAKMIDRSPVAAITPFLRGPKALPSESDISRIKGKTSQIYATAPPGGWRSLSRDPAVERMLGRRLRAMTGNMGHIRVRWSSQGPAQSPAVDLFSGAIQL
jgi:hypothetical protein